MAGKRTILIDDEPKALQVLSGMIKSFCPELEIVGMASSVAEGRALFKQTKPDLIFLDIDLPDGYGFRVIDEPLAHTDFNVVFTTAFSHFAARAFEYAALHYLLKPLDIDQLQEAVARHLNSNQIAIQPDQLEVLTESLNSSPKRVTLETASGMEFVNIDELVYFESNNGVTFAELVDASKKVLSKSLNHYEELLDPLGFCRIHAKYLVNLRMIERISTHGRKAAVLLESGVGLEVSTRKKQTLIERMKNRTHYSS